MSQVNHNLKVSDLQNRTALLSVIEGKPLHRQCCFIQHGPCRELPGLLQEPCLLPEHRDQWNKCGPAGTGEQAGTAIPGKPSRGNLRYWHVLHQSNLKLIKTSFCKVLLSCRGFRYQTALDIMQVNKKFP